MIIADIKSNTVKSFGEESMTALPISHQARRKPMLSVARNISPSLSKIQKAALEYQHRGFVTVALYGTDPGSICTCSKKHDCSSPGKHPRYKKEQWELPPQADDNIAMRTGVSSKVIVLDVDRKKGKDGLKYLQDRGFIIPKTLTSYTPSEGLHYYFIHPSFHVERCIGLFEPTSGLDLLANDQLAAMPPSRIGDIPYEFEDYDTPIAEAPPFLLEAISFQKQANSSINSHVSTSRLSDEILEGTRNNTLASIVGTLLARGVEPMLTLQLALSTNEARCKPPLPKTEVISIVNSIAGKEYNRRLGRKHG